MLSVRTQRQFINPQGRGDGKITMEMRKLSAAAGFLPFQGITQRSRIDRQQQQPVLPGAVLGGTFDDLPGG